MAVKTSQSIGILEYKNDDFQLNFLINNEEINKTKQTISCLEFTQSFYKYKEPMILMIGYKNSKVVLYNIDNRQAYQKYNIYENNKINVIKVLQYPSNLNNNMNYGVLYSDGSLFLMDHKFPNLNYYSSIVKQQNKGFQIRQYQHHQYVENNFEMVDDKVIRLNCQTISDMEIISKQELLCYLQCEELMDKNNESNCFLVGYCGFDGLFRLIDLVGVKNVMSVKSYYGGFNSFSFSKGYELLGLAGQDDCASIIDMKTKLYVRIIQHQSFVSKIEFYKINEDKFVIYSGSLDTRLGSFVTTLKDLQKSMKSNKKQSNCNEIVIDNDQVIEVGDDNYFKISKDAIACIRQRGNLIVISSYDGSVCVWDLIVQQSQSNQVVMK